MRSFLKNNYKWLFNYFKEINWVLNSLSFLFAFQAFFYSVDTWDGLGIGTEEVTALQAVFWILIFLLCLILYVETDRRYTSKDDDVSTSLAEGAVFSKYFLRIIIFILFVISFEIFLSSLQLAWSNPHFSILWYAAIVLVASELVRFIIDMFE